MKTDVSTMAYSDNWLRSEATDPFDQYYELLTEQANQYFTSVLEDY
jgi:DNA-binding transcriptional regulator PaaX